MTRTLAQTICSCPTTAHFPGCPNAPAACQLVRLSAPASPMTGWVCPVCNGGVSPTVMRCPCTPTAGVASLPLGVALTQPGVPVTLMENSGQPA